MLHTFENNERQQLRRQEREKHLSTMDRIVEQAEHHLSNAFAPVLISSSPSQSSNAGDRDGLMRSSNRRLTAQSPTRAASATNITSRRGAVIRGRRLRWTQLVLGGAGLVLVLMIVLLSVKASRNNAGATTAGPPVVEDGSENNNPRPTVDRDHHFTYLENLVLDWGVTDRTTLENAASAPAQALAWLASVDGSGASRDGDGNHNVEMLRTRFALATLYFSTTTTSPQQQQQQQDPPFLTSPSSPSSLSWTNQKHWLSSYPVCLWWGIECWDSDTTTTGLVQAVNLSANGLDGTLPAELTLLQRDCRSLDVSNNPSLHGDIPNLGAMPNLKHLYLGPNRGLTPSRIPSWLYSLTHLEYLFLNECNLQGPLDEGIGQLKKLQRLSLYDNYLTGTVPRQAWNGLSDLNVLYLDGNLFSGTLPHTMSSMHQLVDLRASHNNFEGKIPSSFENLVMLRILYLDRNQLTGSIPTGLGKLSLLHQLHLYQNRLTGSIPDLGILVNILYLDGNKLSGSVGAEIGRLRYLQNLYLFGNSLHGPLPTELGKLEKLETLLVDNNRFIGSIPSELAALDSLETFYAHNNSFSGPVPEITLAGMNALKRVRLDGNDFTGLQEALPRLFAKRAGLN